MTKTPKAKKDDENFPSSRPAAQALEALDSLVLLEEVFQDEAGREFRRLLKWLAKEGGELSRGLRRHGRLWKALVRREEFAPAPQVGTLFQDYFLERLLENDNPFHRKAELKPLSKITPSLGRGYLAEVELIQKVLKGDWEAEFLKKTRLFGKREAPSLEAFRLESRPGAHSPGTKPRQKIKEKLLSAAKGNPHLAEMAEHFYENGWGLFSRYRAFRWVKGPDGQGQLAGVEAVDPIRLENLVGYDEQRQPLLENIEGFVAGKPANNALLYGERGTGKSSTVKALLNAYEGKGLRLVEVTPPDLHDYHEILKPLRGRREKFILFIDDLSFEEGESWYKGLKALLEGTVEATPPNVILIATSNRRHLMPEYFGEREEGIHKDGEVHGQDTVEEKLSLSDRFGLVISFYTPDQETYLKIVENWAKVEGIKMPAAQLRQKALQWEKANNVRSGRTARQFINDLKGKIN